MHGICNCSYISNVLTFLNLHTFLNVRELVKVSKFVNVYIFVTVNDVWKFASICKLKYKGRFASLCIFVDCYFNVINQ